MEQFTDFAYIYDELNVHYDKDGIISRMKQLLGGSREVVDLCCGTGDVAIAMAKIGHNVVGIDVSEDMLNVATEKAMESAARVFFLCEDARSFVLNKKVDAVYSLTDGMNYMLTDEDLEKAFCAVNKALKTGGRFIFDVSTEYKYKSLLKDKTFTFDFDDEFVVWQNEYDEDSCICTMTVTGFVREKKHYTRFDEIHKQKCHSRKTVEHLLDKCSFELVDAFAGYSDKALDDEDERALFVAVKKN